MRCRLDPPREGGDKVTRKKSKRENTREMKIAKERAEKREKGKKRKRKKDKGKKYEGKKREKTKEMWRVELRQSLKERRKASF